MNQASSPSSDEAIRQAAAGWVARRDAGLSDGEAAEFERWRAMDSRHAAAITRYEALWETLDVPRQRGVEQEVTRGLARLRRQDRRRRVIAATAGMAAVIFGLWWWRDAGLVQLAEAGSAPVVVVRPERRVLPDGSILEHSAKARVEIDFTSGAERRAILRQGEAHFQVAKDAARPFVVIAGGTRVRAVGTAFAVQLGATSVEVVVTEGTVAVQPAPPASSTAEATLAAAAVPDAAPTLLEKGHRVVVDLKRAEAVPALAGQVEAISAAEVDQRLAWRNLHLEFSGTPLSGVIAALNRHAAEHGGVKYVLADPGLRRIPFSGIVRVGDSEALVRILEHGFDIRAERQGEERIVLSAAR